MAALNVAPPALPAQRLTGRLSLRFAAEAAGEGQPARTRLAVTEQQPPLQVIRGFELASGGALAHVHNISGGVLSGDQLHLQLEVGPGAEAQVTSTGATRLYRQRPGRDAATQTISAQVADGALLEYLPDPLIPFAGSSYRQAVVIDLAPTAGLFWWEAVAPGREAQGERFAYTCLDLRFSLRLAGRPIALDRARLEPAIRPLTSPARLGPYTHYVNFYICRGGPGPDWAALEAQLTELAQSLNQPGAVAWGASRLPAAGLLVRGLSVTGRALTTGLLHFWQAAKLALYGCPAVPPRKVP